MLFSHARNRVSTSPFSLYCLYNRGKLNNKFPGYSQSRSSNQRGSHGLIHRQVNRNEPDYDSNSSRLSGFKGIHPISRKIKIDIGILQKIQGISSSYNRKVTEFGNPISQQNRPFSTKCSRKESSWSSKFDQRYYHNSVVKTHEQQYDDGPFDICWPRYVNFKMTKKKEIQVETGEVSKGKCLRPGMVLLKHYLTNNQQIEIVKICREHGIRPGGFYRPGYKDGAKLRLQLMCFGMRWDPNTQYAYESQGCEQIPIPEEFSLLVKEAIKDAQAIIKEEYRVTNAEAILPSMAPNICITNFYTTTGRLGLHQDRDESKESLRSGLPVVSFSVGDSAEFLYGYSRDKDKAEKVKLESGDVLIFGGESRLVYHGVTAIIPKSAPYALVAESNIRPGRLNLTFRQY